MFECFYEEIKMDKDKIYISKNLVEKNIIKTINYFNYLLDNSENELCIEMVNKRVEIIN